MKYALSLLLLLSSIITCLAQEIQWASQVAFHYNMMAYSGPYSSDQILGEPNAAPYGQLSPKAIRMADESATGVITVSYQHLMYVEEVVIVESYNPGRVEKVVLIDEDGKEHIVHQSNTSIPAKKYGVFSLKMKQTPYKVREVSLHLNSTLYSGWTQIDALGISGIKADKNYSQSSTIDKLGGISASVKERLPSTINTSGIETKPVISPDGKTLYFHRQNSPGNIGGRKDLQDIYISEFINQNWSYAKNAGRPLNDKLPNGICSVAPDNNVLYVINAYNKNGRIEDGLSYSEIGFDGWTKPEKIEISEYVNKSKFQDYFVSASGTIMILAIEDQSSLGQQDLYASFNKDNRWSKPQNLGKVVNTTGVEYAPFLAADNRTLFFSSTGHKGLGESDIFFSKRLDDSWLSWSEPKNLGDKINTPGWDAYYSISAKGDYAYFVSTVAQGTPKENEDIFRIPLNDEQFRPDPVVLVYGKVFNSQNRQPLKAKVNYESLPVGNEAGVALSNPENGNFKLAVPLGRSYGFYAEANGYYSENQLMNFSDLTEYEEIERDIYLTPLEKGKVIRLNNLFFQQSEAVILPESKPELDRIYLMLSNKTTMIIELGGHTDNQGNFDANMDLSKKRAQAVMDYLTSKGIDKKRMKAVGYGPTKPVANNNNPETRKLNRRVEITILDI